MRKSKIKHVYKNLDVKCGHCGKHTRTLSATLFDQGTDNERLFFGCKDCTFAELNRTAYKKKQ